MSRHSVQAAAACRNCGAAEGNYRHECGEPRPHERELSVKHAIHDAVHELTTSMAESSAPNGCPPGLLAADWWAGKRRSYVRCGASLVHVPAPIIAAVYMYLVMFRIGLSVVEGTSMGAALGAALFMTFFRH